MTGIRIKDYYQEQISGQFFFDKQEKKKKKICSSFKAIEFLGLVMMIKYELKGQNTVYFQTLKGNRTGPAFHSPLLTQIATHRLMHIHQLCVF